MLRGPSLFPLLWSGEGAGSGGGAQFPSSSFVRVHVLALRKGVPCRYARVSDVLGVLFLGRMCHVGGKGMRHAGAT